MMDTPMRSEEQWQQATLVSHPSFVQLQAPRGCGLLGMIFPNAGSLSLPPTRFALKARPYFIGLLGVPWMRFQLADFAS